MFSKLGPVRTAVLLVALIALLVALAWLVVAFYLKPAAFSDSADPSPATPVSANLTPTVTLAVVVSPKGTLIKPPPSVTPLGYGVVTSRTLNLRGAAGTNATVIGSLKLGDIVELVRRDAGWYQTSEGAWLSALYLEVRQTRVEAESYARELLGKL